MTKTTHPYHLVDVSPWPLFTSFALLMVTTGAVMYMHMYQGGEYLLAFGTLLLVLCLISWWRDVIREGTFGGFHTLEVQKGLRIGMVLFIISEIFFFIAFFWAFFHSALTPNIELGSIWPPKGIEALNPWEIPLFNTIILLSSGATMTWAHHALLAGQRRDTLIALLVTIGLGLFFTYLQALEYIEAGFTISDGIYGSTFYGATGLHGLHVIIGTLFLFISFFRLKAYHLTQGHHFGLEAAAWYWHFVDVVWIFLYLSIYYWGY